VRRSSLFRASSSYQLVLWKQESFLVRPSLPPVNETCPNTSADFPSIRQSNRRSRQLLAVCCLTKPPEVPFWLRRVGLLAPRKDIIALTAKLERAEEHIFNLEEAWAFFIKSDPYPLKSKYNAKTRKHVYRLTHAAPVPPSIPLLAGDAIQNTRSALDHLAYRLVCVGTKSPGPFHDVYFPIGDSAKKFKTGIGRIKKRLRPDAIKPLTDIQAHPRGHGRVLWYLRQLNNIDKHRLLLTVSA